jgi:hypothetical protein
MTLKDIKVIMGAYDIHIHTFTIIGTPLHPLEHVWNPFRKGRGQVGRGYYE